MTFALRSALRARSLLFDDEAIALRRVEAADAALHGRARAELDRPAADVARLLASRASAVRLGTALDGGGASYPVMVPESEIRSGGHGIITAATGAGKTFAVLGILLQLMARDAQGIVVIDMKGELAQLLREAVLPAVIASLSDDDAGRLLGRVAVVAPFDEDAAPPFQVLAREPGVPLEVHVHAIASSFGTTIGRDLGPLQRNVLVQALMLASDVGLTFADVPRLLHDAAFLRGALGRTRLPEVRAFFAERFGRERGSSVASLLSRLDVVLMHPGLRRLLSARGMVNFSRLLPNALTIVDLGGAPAGMRPLATFFGQLLFGRIVRATFARTVTDRSPPVTVFADEFQELLGPDVASDFERFLTLARSQRVFLWSMFQQAAQVEAVSPLLLRILRTNTNYAILGRSDPADARAMAYALPGTAGRARAQEGFPDPRSPASRMSEGESRAEAEALVPRLPDRVFWFANRRRPYPAILMRSVAVPLASLRRSAASLPAEILRQASRGVLAVSRDELDATLAERARFSEAVARGSAQPDGTEPPVEPRAPSPEEPGAPQDPAPAGSPQGSRRRRRRNGRGPEIG